MDGHREHCHGRVLILHQVVYEKLVKKCPEAVMIRACKRRPPQTPANLIPIPGLVRNVFWRVPKNARLRYGKSEPKLLSISLLDTPTKGIARVSKGCLPGTAAGGIPPLETPVGAPSAELSPGQVALRAKLNSDFARHTPCSGRPQHVP